MCTAEPLAREKLGARQEERKGCAVWAHALAQPGAPFTSCCGSVLWFASGQSSPSPCSIPSQSLQLEILSRILFLAPCGF